MLAFRGAIVLLVCAFVISGETAARRSLNLDDLYRLAEVDDPQVSPDGNWIAYTVTTVDKEGDKHVTRLWMAKWDGSEELQLTYDKESASSPRWSPDGRYLSFVSGREGPTKGSQIWVMDRRGGEARQITHLKNYTISSYDWSPDSARLLLVLREKDEPEKEKSSTESDEKPAKPPKPVVVDRYHFKEDVEGYLNKKKNHLYLFEIATEKLVQLTSGNFDETDAVWSPNGAHIAFVSNRDADPDRTENTDIFVIDPQQGAVARKLTTFAGPDTGRLSWSPDSKSIVYLQGSESRFSAYNMDRLATVGIEGTAPQVLTQSLGRGVSLPQFSSDGKAIYFLVANDRRQYPAAVNSSGGEVRAMLDQSSVESALSSRAGHTAVVASTDSTPTEIFCIESGKMRQISHRNDELVAAVKFGAVQDISFKSPDGTEVHGFITKPPDFVSGRRYPTLLRIHGGPNGQDEHAFRFDLQFFAAHGYITISVNYRGSSGRGEQYGQSIFGDWGHKEVADLLAGVDHVLQMGVADPDRLGIGGWSYGGILTDYTIASDQRFKAAISGAGSANQISMYGVDEYVFQYDEELGPPWQNPDGWIKVSYPFFHADRIHTPTLFMGGDKDFNVPLVGSEQMYQALRTLNVTTELIIYPGEFHQFKRPSFMRDRYERYIDWYDRYLKAPLTAGASAKTGAQ